MRNPTRNYLSYWNKKISIVDSKKMDPNLGRTKIGKNYYYGRKINTKEEIKIVFQKIIPILFISLVFAPLSVPIIFTYTNLYRHLGRWFREIKYDQKLSCINNIAAQKINTKKSKSCSASVIMPKRPKANKPKTISPMLNIEEFPQEIIKLISISPIFSSNEEIKSYFGSFPLVCKNWHANFENTKFNLINSHKVRFCDIHNFDSKNLIFEYVEKYSNNIKILDLSNYKITDDDIANIVHKCPNLEFLIFENAIITDVAFYSICQLINLKHLIIKSCSNLLKIPSLAGLSQLEELEISNCHKIVSIETFDNLSNLKILKLFFISDLHSIPSLDQLKQLENFQIHAMLSLSSLPAINQLTNLKKLIIYFTRLQSIPSFENLNELNEIWIDFNSKLKYIPDLNLPKLNKLVISSNKKLMKIPTLNSLLNLKILEISNNDSLEAVPEHCINLKNPNVKLKITNNKKLKEIDIDIDATRDLIKLVRKYIDTKNCKDKALDELHHALV